MKRKARSRWPHQFTNVPPGPQAEGHGACDGGRRGDHHTERLRAERYDEPARGRGEGKGHDAASDANLAATTNDTIIIPGHGRPVSNKAELKEFRDMLVAIRENVAKLKKQGRSRDETVAAKPTAARVLHPAGL
jgi:hypothetical protein